MSKWKPIAKWHESKLQKSFKKSKHKCHKLQLLPIAHAQQSKWWKWNAKAPKNIKEQIWKRSPRANQKCEKEPKVWAGTWKIVVVYNLECARLFNMKIRQEWMGVQNVICIGLEPYTFRATKP